MNKKSKIYVAGHTGLVGSSIVQHLREKGYENIITESSAKLDLTRQEAVEKFFEATKPDYVFLAAAKVGGILANSTYPADFIQINLNIQTNIIHAAWKHNVKRLLFLGSSCIYPRDCQQPIKENYLLTGPLETTNKAFAVAKIAGIEMCKSYNQQYGTQFLAVMFTNLYGKNDNYQGENSHVIPALLKKFHQAKIAHEETVTVWGTGIARREFLYSTDAADACIYLLTQPEDIFLQLLHDSHSGGLINIGRGYDVTIKELVELIKKIVEFKGDIIWDTSKPDGTLQKLLDITKLTHLGWTPTISLEEGLKKAYQEYIKTLVPINNLETSPQ